jgi:hypothetical protein
MWVKTPERISVTFFINPSHQSVCLYVYPYILLGNGTVNNPPIVARHRLYKKVAAVPYAHAAIEDLLDVSISIQSSAYLGKYTINSSQNFLFILFFAVWIYGFYF